MKGEAAAKATPKKATNVAKSVGSGKAKRSAAADQVHCLLSYIAHKF